MHCLNNDFPIMKNIIVSIILLLNISLSAWPINVTDDQVEESLSRLDKAMKDREYYINLKLSKIDSLKNELNNSTTNQKWLEIQMEIGNSYCAFNNDSALIYYTDGYNKAQSINAKDMAMMFKIKRATYLPLGGFTHDAYSEFEAIDPDSVPDNMKAFYYESGRQLYSYIASFFSHYDEPAKYWNDKSSRYRDLFLSVQDENSDIYKLNYGEALYEKGDLTKAKAILMDLVEILSPESNLYARACHILASIADQRNDRNEAINYLSLSAIADIKGAILEVMSLQELGVMMSERNDINRAYNYLSTALSNAVDCHASARIVQTSAAMPLIQKTHNDQIREWRHKIYIVIMILAIILIGLFALLLYLRRQMKRMTDLQNRLRGANQVKEVYISQFFRLCSIYIDKLNQFCKIANRKISSGQVDDLYKITKSGKLVEEQSREFYQLFDDAFLHIYPTFVEDVNNLLREKITLKEGELLNNDLRILAFLRLGLEDTNQVAQILNYSVNTIYAYRNKLRNRAYDRDNFEKNIMNISSI